MWKQQIIEKTKELCGIDIRSLALFRIGLGLILLADLIIRAHDIVAHYSDMGLLPRDVLINMIHPASFSLHLMNGTWQFQLFLFLIAIIFATALLFGYRTRFATICSWLFLISLQTRNPLILQGGDIVLRLLLFWGMFLPLGACWSMDNKLGKTIRPENQIVSVATLSLLLQICFIYWFTALLKTDDTWRTDGTAIWYALSIEQYATSLGHFLLNFPNFLKFSSFSTFYLEALGPFLAFSPIWTGPLRFATVILFILFHITLNITMELGVFSYICSVAWLVFLPGWFWDKILKFKDNTNIPYKASWLTNTLAAFFIAFIFLWNVRTLETSPSLVPAAFSKIEAIGPLLNIEQYWNMFSPYPIKADGWFVIPGKLRDETKVDLFTDGGPVSWEKPPLLSAIYSNDRWRSFMMNLVYEEDTETALLHYARYLCRQWNETHPYEKQVMNFKIFFMLKINSLENPPKDYDKTLLWEHQCVDPQTE
jgi:hypothetical protein